MQPQRRSRAVKQTQRSRVWLTWVWWLCWLRPRCGRCSWCCGGSRPGTAQGCWRCPSCCWRCRRMLQKINTNTHTHFLLTSLFMNLTWTLTLLFAFFCLLTHGRSCTRPWSRCCWSQSQSRSWAARSQRPRRVQEWWNHTGWQTLSRQSPGCISSSRHTDSWSGLHRRKKRTYTTNDMKFVYILTFRCNHMGVLICVCDTSTYPRLERSWTWGRAQPAQHGWCSCSCRSEDSRRGSLEKPRGRWGL